MKYGTMNQNGTEPLLQPSGNTNGTTNDTQSKFKKGLEISLTIIALFPFKLIIIAIDLLITIVTFGWVKAFLALFKGKPVRSVPVDNDPSHRVRPDFKNNLIKTPRIKPECTTLYEIVNDSFKKHADKECFKTRKYLGMKSVKPPIKHFDPDSLIVKTYAEVDSIAHRFGAALRQEGLVPSAEVATLEEMTTPCSLAIFENTCAEWITSAIGAFSQSIVVTTIYATLGMDAVVTAIQDGKISAIVCNKKDVKKVLSRSVDVPTLKTIIYTSDIVAESDVIDLGVAPAGVKVVSFEDFVDNGDVKAFPPTPPKPSSMAVLMYTSGSTGKPKGVVITHAQCTSTTAALCNDLIESTDVYLGYLPLAHILELMAEFSLLTFGAKICYADPKTLTTKGSYPKGALEQFKPTIMAGVPKVWDIIKKGAEAKIAASKPIAKFLVATAFQWRKFALDHGFDTPLFKALVFKKFSALVGGRLRLAMSGGGALNSEVQDFIRTCFGIPFGQGYGLTETNAGCTLQAPDDLRCGIAGQLIPSVEVKLRSVPDINDKAGNPYLSTDLVDVDGNVVHGRGEIMIRGPSLSLGYYTMPEKTKEVFRDDGFFTTGDIGQFMEDGSIRIVDRVKNLVKLKGGEYIAIEKMEMTYGNSKFVDAVAGGICCYGDGDMDRPIALMQLSEPYAMAWAKENNVAGDFGTVKESKELYDAVLADMKKEHAKGGLSHIEKLVGLCFLTEPWTPENGCLTAANKLQRRVVIETFLHEFELTKAKGVF